jgi:hypothetical protein
MPIEFNCSQCNQLLRVSEASAGKSARCPKCQALMMVPAAGGEPVAPVGGGFSGFTPSSSASPFAPATPPPPANPFAGPPMPPTPPKPAGNPFAPESGNLNPYAAPTGGYEQTTFAVPGGPITNVPVSFDPVWNHAFRVWQANLGLLVGAMAIFIGISIAIAIPMAIVQAALEQNGEEELAAVLGIVGNIVSNVIQIFLGIGQARISLKLARGMPAAISDVFSGGPRFLPVLGGSILAGIALFFGALLCIVPAILMALWAWPFYYLIIEEKASVLDSFSVAMTITERNRGTTFVIWIVSVGVSILGCCAVYIGLIFAMPLVSVMWATAYLMMSGQLASQPQYGKY